METPTRADPPEQHSATPRGPAHAHAPRRRRVLRVLGWCALVLLVLVLLVGTITAIAGLSAKRSLDRGRAELQDGKRALVAGDLGRATDAFSTAEASFSDAEARVSGGLAGVASSMPLAGRTLRVVDGVAVAGRELAAAGGQLSAAVGRLPDGLGSLSPVNGRIPVEEIASLSDDVRDAAAHAEAAQAALDATPSSLLVAPVADARNEAVVQVSAAATTLRSASSLLDAFPAFAGADGPRRYLLVAESPAEQRGTGGIWGAYAVLTANDGRLTVSPFKGVLTLKQLPPDAVPAPNPDYRRNYDAYGGAGSFRDLNMTPDFPSAAKAALGNYEASTGERLDGVISVDPFALQHLLSVTGPAEVPHLGITVGSGTVVDLLANEAYIRFANQGKARKAVLGAVAGLAFERFLEQPGQALAKLKAVGRSVSDGNLKVYSTDPTFEQGLATAGRDGALAVPQGDDLLSVVVNSLSGSKIDYYVTRSLTYDVELGGDGQAFGTTEVTLRNDAPSSGIPGDVIHPTAKGYESGDVASLVTSSCPGSCGLVSAQRDGEDVKLRVGEELGHHWYQDVMVVPSRTSSSLRIVTSRGDAWQGNSTGGTYALRILPQTTVKTTHVRVKIHAPAGTRISWTSEPMDVQGGAATWEGDPRGPLTLEVRFGAPIPLSWWRNLTRPLT